MDSQPIVSAAGPQLQLSGPPSGSGYDQTLALAGKDIPVTLVGQGADGARLELPSGQVITARGNLPFPENTKLQVRVTVQEGSVRLQVLEALPPSPAQVLAPLVQSEAGALLRLLQSESLPEVALPLARLFAELSPSGQHGLEQAIESLPPQTQRTLAALLGLKEGSPAAIARELVERFEPAMSLAELVSLLMERHAATAPANTSDLGSQAEALRSLLANLLMQNPAIAAGPRAQGQAESLSKALVDELLSALKPLLEPGDTASAPRETPQAQEPLPDAGKAAAEQSGSPAQEQPAAAPPKDGASKTAQAPPDTVNVGKAPQEQPGSPAKASSAAPADGSADKVAPTQGKAQTQGQAPPPETASAAKAAAEGLVKMMQALGSMPGNAYAAAVADRTATLALVQLMRLAVATLTGETAALDPAPRPSPAETGDHAPGSADDAARDTKAQPESQGCKGTPGAGGTANADRPTRADRAPEARTAPQDTVGQQSVGAKPAPGRAPEETIRAALPEPPPKAAGQEQGQAQTAAKDFPLLRQIADLVKSGNGAAVPVGTEGEGAATAPAENQTKGADSAPVPQKNEAEPSRPEARKTPQAPENQPKVAEKSEAAPAANARSSQTATIEPPIGNPQAIRTQASIQDALIGQLANAIAKAELDVEPTPSVTGRQVEVVQSDAPAIKQEGGRDEGAKEIGTARLTELLEKLPAPVRRAVALAVLTPPDTDAKTIAETLIQRGGATVTRQELASKLDTASPVVRQLTALAAGLPLDAGTEKIAGAAFGADKGTLEAAKAILAINEGDRPDADKKIGPTIKEHGKEQPAPSFDGRISHLLRFEALLSQQAPTQQDKDSLSSWFRSIVDLLMSVKSAKQDLVPDRRSDAPQASAGNIGRRTATAAPQGAERTQAAAQQAPGAAPQTAQARQTGELVQTWHSWLDGCIRTLADPAAAKEAAFHAMAAKENVNYFELPIPWMPGRALEMWVESDAEKNQKGKGGPSHRVLLGMTFSVLGETRVGLESTGKRLNIRIWAEQTKPIESVLPKLVDELSALGFEAAVTLNSLAAGNAPPAPSIKSALGGSSLNAIG